MSLARCSLLLVVLSLLSPTLFAADKPLNTPPEGFKALFNGKDLTGWKGLVKNVRDRQKMTPDELAKAQEEADKIAHEHWKVEDGVLVYSGKGHMSLSTATDYGNFELYVDWKIKEFGDSGIYLRGTPQVQIWDPKDPNQLKNGCDKGSGSLWNNQKNPRFPDVVADNPIGEWNTFHIKMVGEKVTIHLNGKLVVDNVTLENYWERDKPVYATGPIELQDHGNTLYFRNIYIKELP
jgi:3-keto-disaccharide hydrolase